MTCFFPPSKVHLLLRKGIYPYDYMDTIEKFDETALPTKKDFYSVLNESEISDDNYLHANTVWKEFEIKNLGEYAVYVCICENRCIAFG